MPRGTFRVVHVCLSANQRTGSRAASAGVSLLRVVLPTPLSRFFALGRSVKVVPVADLPLFLCSSAWWARLGLLATQSAPATAHLAARWSLPPRLCPFFRFGSDRRATRGVTCLCTPVIAILYVTC